MTGLRLLTPTHPPVGSHDRIDNLRKKLVEAALSEQVIEKLKELVADAGRKANAAAKMSFADGPLPEIGEAVWRKLWEAVRRYSAVAYPGDFPDVVSDDAVCVLCQQPLRFVTCIGHRRGLQFG